jgi:phage terminase small subunit
MAGRKKKTSAKRSKKKKGKKQVPAKAEVELTKKKDEDGLTNRQRMFVDEYLIDLNATQAAIRAGYSKKTAHEIGHENLKKHDIRVEINRAIKERRDRTKMEGDEVLIETARLARSDILNYVNFGPNGIAIRDSSELLEGEARAISQISETFNSQGIRQIKFKLHDKIKALDLLAKHLKLYEEQPINVNISWMDLVKSAKKTESQGNSE